MIEFYKTNGAGNDFIIIDDRDKKIENEFKDINRWVEKICERRFSVGADGVILIQNDLSDDVDFRWKFYNSDGSEAEMCGNGARCVSRIAYELGIAGKKPVFRTKAGIIKAEILDRNRVKVHMIDPKNLKSFVAPEGMPKGGFVDSGVPHMVYPVKNVAQCDLMGIGAKTRCHSFFGPNGTNVDFIEILDRHNIKMRTYERGVEGETLACGTGATASALIAFAHGLVERPVKVHTITDKELVIDFEYDGKKFSSVSMEGEASVSYRGYLIADACTLL